VSKNVGAVAVILAFMLLLCSCGGAETTAPPLSSVAANTTAHPATTAAPQPTVVATGAAAVITASGATLNGEISKTGSDAADQRGFDWGTVSGKYDGTWTENGTFPSGPFSRAVTGLTPGGAYFFRSKAHNSAGWAYGQEQAFKTLADAKITSIAPNKGKQGETLKILISGSGFTGTSSVSFSDNVTVNEFVLSGDTQITANITIADSAVAGDRAVSIKTPAGTVTSANGFAVERVLRTVTWTDADFDWMCHLLTGSAVTDYHIHFVKGNRMTITASINFNFGMEVRNGKISFNEVPSVAWQNLDYLSQPNVKWDAAQQLMVIDSFPQQATLKLFNPPENTLPAIVSLTTGDGTLILTYYSP
jgi:hypothetical protein